MVDLFTGAFFLELLDELGAVVGHHCHLPVGFQTQQRRSAFGRIQIRGAIQRRHQPRREQADAAVARELLQAGRLVAVVSKRPHDGAPDPLQDFLVRPGDFLHDLGQLRQRCFRLAGGELLGDLHFRAAHAALAGFFHQFRVAL